MFFTPDPQIVTKTGFLFVIPKCHFSHRPEKMGRVNGEDENKKFYNLDNTKFYRT